MWIELSQAWKSGHCNLIPFFFAKLLRLCQVEQGSRVNNPTNSLLDWGLGLDSATPKHSPHVFKPFLCTFRYMLVSLFCWKKIFSLVVVLLQTESGYPPGSIFTSLPQPAAEKHPHSRTLTCSMILYVDHDSIFKSNRMGNQLRGLILFIGTVWTCMDKLTLLLCIPRAQQSKIMVWWWIIWTIERRRKGYFPYWWNWFSSLNDQVQL